ncbi:hypothetical protein AG1IA_03178 [Rhizoctonia solani AG-1 IA]|uniref:Uncharacterized protein n=1 Tax=Thanatephorus cucumeris (strain AG1-IA) TaxID=983506 RepID=L8X1B3_THACA|nr:hypothetical protein AG1IA_03178 [Rhizoctonia solani AG-1 IA]
MTPSCGLGRWDEPTHLKGRHFVSDRDEFIVRRINPRAQRDVSHKIKGFIWRKGPRALAAGFPRVCAHSAGPQRPWGALEYSVVGTSLGCDGPG